MGVILSLMVFFFFFKLSGEGLRWNAKFRYHLAILMLFGLGENAYSNHLCSFYSPALKKRAFDLLAFITSPKQHNL
jgi:hypothetical protein